MHLNISSEAPVTARCVVKAHNVLHTPACRQFLSAVLVGAVVLTWLALGVWWFKARNLYQTQQHVASDLLMAFESSGKALFVTDGDGKVVLSTTAADKLVGYKSLGENILQLCPETQEPFKIAVNAANKKPCGHGVAQYILPAARHDETLLQVTVTAAKIADRLVVVVTELPLDALDDRAVEKSAKN